MKRSIPPENSLYPEFQRYSQQLRERITMLRKERGLTQEDMQSFGLSLRQYQRIESGETENITLANLYRLAIAFELTPAELMDV
ncbi:helix-turn-helix transcriptional regulator [Porticoccaceae bacterium LTM1]|nr:helix-turn-helix transcriptional regulator [Porticoccaceae bacterium LTM1]